MISLDRDISRWYALTDHPVQQALITDNVRFKVVPAGRRSGKTERAKRFIVKEANRIEGDYFIGAPTRDQVKRIYWNDLKRLSLSSALPDAPLESELKVRYPNGSSITLIGLDQSQRIEGTIWAGGIIDEIADTKEGTWEENISPALDTFNPQKPDYRAWCWLIGVPEGLNFYYDLAEYARTSGDPDWKLYTWKSSDILPPDVIEAAKRRMSPRQYRQEYEASFETATGRIYDDYSYRNETVETIMEHEELLWAHDFNYSPMSSVVCVVRNNVIFALDEIILTSAVAKESAIEFVERYKDHSNKVMSLYGDPAGKAGEKHNQDSDFTIIESILRSNGWTVKRKVKAAAPTIKNRQNQVRARILNANDEVNLFVNPKTAPYMHKGLSTCTVKKGSSFIEEVTDYQHITTALGYMIDYDFIMREEEKSGLYIPQPKQSNSWMAR